MSRVLVHSLSGVLERIETIAVRAGRDPREVQLVVVTKGVALERIREVVAAGALILGENRIQEALPKIEALALDTAPSLTGLSRMARTKVCENALSQGWHLVGYLQRNKARQAVGVFELIHSVDRLELARELNRHAQQKGIIQKVLVQVNVAGEVSKYGVSPDQAGKLVGEVAALPHLELKGLMTIPPLPATPEDSRPHYRRLRALARSIGKETGISMTELSMGMSRDFEVAIEEGATLVRIGTAIFR